MGTARPYSPVNRPQTERAGAALTPTFLCHSRAERGPKMRFLLLTAALVAMVSAREPEVNVITLDSCIGTQAPVDADTRPLELREKDAADAAAKDAADAAAKEAADAAAKEAADTDTASERSLHADSRSADVEEMEASKHMASPEDTSRILPGFF